MRAIICDRCGKTERQIYYGSNIDLRQQTVGSPMELQLCRECTSKLLDWIKEGEKDAGYNPERP